MCVKQDHKERDFLQSQRGGPGKGMHGQSHRTPPIQQQQFTNNFLSAYPKQDSSDGSCVCHLSIYCVQDRLQSGGYGD